MYDFETYVWRDWKEYKGEYFMVKMHAALLMCNLIFISTFLILNNNFNILKSIKYTSLPWLPYLMLSSPPQNDRHFAKLEGGLDKGDFYFSHIYICVLIWKKFE